ncbi:hypothetical protein [Nocardioides campestrisoli]|uniref:hypothetical protein n=1 Tax=Nocardioides campestrisoli TaxID=2736757 RepID=UPI0015E70574|nr:hypothetical protein [Nocardioides campestrisoli]
MTQVNQAHERSVAYALNGLEGIDLLRFEGHLIECTDCREDVEDVRDAAELLSAGIELTPTSSLRTRVQELTSRPVETVPEPALAQPAAPLARRRRWLSPGV